jgi:hypothetical protein
MFQTGGNRFSDKIMREEKGTVTAPLRQRVSSDE